MDIFTFAVLVYFGVIIFAANQEAAAAPIVGTTLRLRAMLYSVAVMTFLYGLLVFQAAFFSGLPETEGLLPSVDVGAALVSLLLSTAAALFAWTVITHARTREVIQRVLGADAAYKPESPVHTTAIVLTLAVASAIIGNFVLGGGIAGLAEALETEGLSFGSLVFQLLVFVLVSFLGVGLFIRRDARTTLARLGLRLPRPQETTTAILTGIGLYGVTLLLNALWLVIASPEQIAEQTAASEGLAQALNTLPLLLLVSISAPLGEEILFRGALQPVFGVWATSALFTLLHTQYALTPATLAIFLVSLGLAWLRRRHSTSAAIIGHFVYNFVQLVPLIVLTAAGG
jgi:hypothetical protein